MSDLIQLRKITMHFEEIYHEGGPPPGQPLVRAAILAVAAATPTPGAMSRT